MSGITQLKPSTERTRSVTRCEQKRELLSSQTTIIFRQLMSYISVLRQSTFDHSNQFFTPLEDHGVMENSR